MSNTITVSDNGQKITVKALGTQGPAGTAGGSITALQAFSGVGTVADPLDFSAFKVITQPSDLLLYGTYAAGVYTLPTADRYYFRGAQNYGTDRIELTETNGIYAFTGSHFDQLTYTGTGNFISTTSTGQSLNLIHMFITAATGTAIKMTNFNSCIMEFPVFINCKTCIDLDIGAFFTNEVLVMVACENGVIAKDVGTMSARIIQWSVGRNAVDAVAVTMMGAASERCFISQADSRPLSNECYLDIQADYAGLVDLVGGVHTTGAGDFFKAGSRNQNDVDIAVTAIQNVTSSHSTVALHVSTGDELATTIIDGVETVIAGTYTTSLAQRFTVDGAKVTYIGNETEGFGLALKCLAVPASGNDRDYDFYIRKNGTTLIPISYDLVISVAAGSPQKVVCVGSVELSTGDFLEPIVIAQGNNNNVTCSAMAFIIG